MQKECLSVYDKRGAMEQNDLTAEADKLRDYLRDALHANGRAKLDVDSLPEWLREFGRDLVRYTENVRETGELAASLAKGELAEELHCRNNPLAAPLKSLHASLQHLTWQTQRVAEGDYHQRVEFMGDFATAFNDMIVQLDKRRSALEKARRDAETANKAKSEFLATISHEMRTPLNAIIGLSEIQLQDVLPDSIRPSIEKIHTGGMLLLDIVNDVLDISKIEAGALEFVPVAYETPNLINEVIQFNILRIGSKRISFTLELDESIPSKLYGDELRLKQILNNLLSNAFKYTEEGRVTFRVDWEKKDDDAWIIFTVSDTGAGIKEEDIKNLFSEYRKFDTRIHRKVEGTGLGLTITKKLVALMGGTISVQSQYGKGSVFAIRVRQGITDPAPIGHDSSERLRSLRFTDKRSVRLKALARTPMPDGKVLVVDDVATNLVVAKGLLKPYGLTVHTACSGREAIAMIRSEAVKYDAVFMDHMMPEVDGIEATRYIRNDIGTEYARSVPIIALTANAVSGSREMFLANGFNGFISKPIDISQLDSILNQCVLRKAADAKTQ